MLTFLNFLLCCIVVASLKTDERFWCQCHPVLYAQVPTFSGAENTATVLHSFGISCEVGVASRAKVVLKRYIII